MNYFLSAIAAATLTITTAATTAAQAQDLVKEAGGWEIYRSADMGGGCFMSSLFDDGSLIQLGFDLSEDAAFMSVFNESWDNIADGETYPVTLQLDNETYTAEAHGLKDADLSGILVTFDNEDFLVDLAQRKVLSLSDSDQEVARIDLSGTRDAVLATIDCLPS